jgi:RNA polymerase sigma-70 factor (ECF subfamily)
MEQRLVRAKRKIKLAGIPFEIPTGQQIAVRLHGVLQTVYLLFNEGYSASSGASLVNVSICDEALGLGKLLVDLFPGNAEVLALLALMLLQDSRRDARSTDTGALVLLKDQNRTNWNHDQIKLGLEILDQSLGLKQRPAFFQLQATIAALHAQAESFEKTDWAEIGLVYQVLLKHVPVKSDAVVIWLNYAVVLAMQGQFQEGLSLLTELQPGLLNYHPYYLARAELQLMATEAGDPGISIDTSPEEDLEKALSLTRNDAERQYLQARLKQIRQKKG